MKNAYNHLLNDLLVSLTKEEVQDMKAYFYFYDKSHREISESVERELQNHKVFGELLRAIPREELEKQNERSKALQYNAIFNNDWAPYMDSQAVQGVTYARIGVEFYMWYDVLSILRNYTMSILLKDQTKSQQEIWTVIRGMNRIFDLSMSIISEAYLYEKKKIIEEQKQQQEKLNKDLKRVLDTLREKNKDLEQFAYIASHDLQEPLRMVTSFLSQLEKKYKEKLDEKAQQYIHFAVDGAVRMRKIILDLLEYSRVGRKENEMETVDMNQLLNEVVQLNSTLIKEKQAVIKWTNLPTINAAKTPLQQVLQNLIGNALKYQKTGETPIVEIGATETDTHWKFSVSDNGIGIEPQFFEKIFVIFQRLHNKDEYSGTGIGLAICKKIIEAHLGEIWLESTPGIGTTFYFTIAKP